MLSQPCDEWLLAQTESESLREGELLFSDLHYLITSGRYQEGLGGLIIFIRGWPVSSLVGGGGALKEGQKGMSPSPPAGQSQHHQFISLLTSVTKSGSPPRATKLALEKKTIRVWRQHQGQRQVDL